MYKGDERMDDEDGEKQTKKKCTEKVEMMRQSKINLNFY